MAIATPEDQNHFRFILPPDQQWFSPKEVARVIGRTDQFVRDAFENQKILGHLNNGRAQKGRERRCAYQIHREGVILFLLQTANYRPSDFLDLLCEILRNRSTGQIIQIQRFLSTRRPLRRGAGGR